MADLLKMTHEHV